jgi:hypothetical protein
MPTPKAAPKKATTATAAKPVAKKPAPAKPVAKKAVAAKPVAVKKPAPAKKPAAKAPVAVVKSPVVKKPAAKKPAVKKAAVAPAVKPAVKAVAKPVAAKKPAAKVAPADGIKKTAIPAKLASPVAIPLDAPATKEQAATITVVDLTTLNAAPSDHVVVAVSRPSDADYTVAFFGRKGGVAFREISISVTEKSKKRISAEKAITSVLKAVLSYENKRSQGKAFRGLTDLSAVITRTGTSTQKQLSVLLHLNPVQASAC